jgi:glycine reductase
VISKELDREGIPVALISAMYPVAEQVGASRVVKGLRIPHPCGDPNLPAELDARVRQEIVMTALNALGTEVTTTTTFESELSPKA